MALHPHQETSKGEAELGNNSAVAWLPVAKCRTSGAQSCDGGRHHLRFPQYNKDPPSFDGPDITVM
jgi:hypothetical protein